jgi:hypothetical protein
VYSACIQPSLSDSLAGKQGSLLSTSVHSSHPAYRPQQIPTHSRDRLRDLNKTPIPLSLIGIGL